MSKYTPLPTRVNVAVWTACFFLFAILTDSCFTTGFVVTGLAFLLATIVSGVFSFLLFRRILGFD